MPSPNLLLLVLVLFQGVDLRPPPPGGVSLRPQVQDGDVGGRLKDFRRLGHFAPKGLGEHRLNNKAVNPSFSSQPPPAAWQEGPQSPPAAWQEGPISPPVTWQGGPHSPPVARQGGPRSPSIAWPEGPQSDMRKKNSQPSFQQNILPPVFNRNAQNTQNQQIDRFWSNSVVPGAYGNPSPPLGFMTPRSPYGSLLPSPLLGYLTPNPLSEYPAEYIAPQLGELQQGYNAPKPQLGPLSQSYEAPKPPLGSLYPRYNAPNPPLGHLNTGYLPGYETSRPQVGPQGHISGSMTPKHLNPGYMSPKPPTDGYLSGYMTAKIPLATSAPRNQEDSSRFLPPPGGSLKELREEKEEDEGERGLEVVPEPTKELKMLKTTQINDDNAEVEDVNSAKIETKDIRHLGEPVAPGAREQDPTVEPAANTQDPKTNHFPRDPKATPEDLNTQNNPTEDARVTERTKKLAGPRFVGEGLDAASAVALPLSGRPVGAIHDTPTDGLFLVLVLGLTLGCVVVVIGAGWLMNSPAPCPLTPGSRGSSSPTFTSAKLAFRSPTEEPSRTEQTFNSGKRMGPGDWKEERGGGVDGWREERGRTPNRPTTLNTQPSKKKSAPRLESLIDLDYGEDDETIYECPGLAPPGEMVVTNPFFLSGGFQDHEEDPHLAPCPVNVNNNIKHGNINPILSH